VKKAKGQTKRDLSYLVSDLESINTDLTLKTSANNQSAEFKTVERIFVYLQVLSAAFVAFAHGANDVANAVGPMAAVVTVLKTGAMSAKSAVPLWILALGGVGIVIGLSTWGWRVMLTIGKKITELTPTRGFAAEFAAATTIVLASKLGLPVSTTHTLVGGVLGVGFARGIGALNLKVVGNIVISWVITIPVGAAGAIFFYYIFKLIFG
jgi:phosphate/sulfate permease